MVGPEMPIVAPPGAAPTQRGLVRERAYLIAVLAILAIGAVGYIRPISYVALGPGPVTNTLGLGGGSSPLIRVTGFKTYPSTGQLDLTTVTVTSRLTLVQALLAWHDKKRAVLPRELIFPKDLSAKQVDAQNQTEMADSRTDAVTAALAKLNLFRVIVGGTAKGSPAARALKAGDQIVGINGQTVHSSFDVRAFITQVKAGQRVAVRFVRAGIARTAVLRTVSSGGDQPRAVIGVTALKDTTPKGSDVKIVGLSGVGGPSAGLMFALGIYDRLTPGDLTGGHIVAGTGTIDGGGNVGAIGGIQLKMIAAHEQGSAWFLTPADNCAEAKRTIPKGLRLAKVSTLDQAISAVSAIAAGSNAIPTC